MKPTIHPKWYPDAKFTCACGHAFTVGATKPEIHVEICSHCHPFYTGKQKLMDTARRVEQFEARVSKQAAAAGIRKGKKAKRVKAELRKASKKPKLEREEGLSKAPPASAK
ncbi:MAG: 50S ribosomal protein L31 [Patescibacteria group bacterium]|nr:50S ribosomal protein L31 [Patescibacteria group bacterium]